MLEAAGCLVGLRAQAENAVPDGEVREFHIISHPQLVEQAIPVGAHSLRTQAQ